MVVKLAFEEDVLRLICGMLCKVEEAWKKNSHFMMSCIVQMI